MFIFKSPTNQLLMPDSMMKIKFNERLQKQTYFESPFLIEAIQHIKYERFSFTHCGKFIIVERVDYPSPTQREKKFNDIFTLYYYTKFS